MQTSPRRSVPSLHSVSRSLLVCLAIWLPHGRAQAGNDDGILIGSQASLTGGAITATVSDGSSAWYNPAGIAQLDRQALDINASVYGVNLFSAKNLFTLPDGTQKGASVVDWVLLPSALSYSRQLSERVVGSFGVFMPHTTDLDLQSSWIDAQNTRWVVGVDQVHNEYDYILSIGLRLTDDLRLGFALHGIYIAQEDMTQVGFGTEGDPAASFLTSSTHSTTADYGLRVGLGVQWDPVPGLKLGLALQTPTLTAFRRVAEYSLGSLFVPDGSSGFTSEKSAGLKSVWELSTPLSMRAGMACNLDRLTIMLDGSLMSALDARGTEIDRRWSGNVRAAGLFRLSDTITIGLGVFSDLNGLRTRDPNFLGVAGGVRIGSDYHIVEGKRLLTFLTTLGGRYAYGFGYTEGIRFLGVGADIGAESQWVRIRAHELALNLGGGVTF